MLRHRTPIPRARHRRARAAYLAAAAFAALAGAVAGPAAAGLDPASPAAFAPPPWDVNSAVAAAPPGDMYETFAPDGSIALRHGTPYRAPRPLPVPLRLRDAGGPSATLNAMHRDGDPANRVNVVFIGDGYTAAEQDVFNASAEQAWQALMDYEPYKTYQHFFNAWRVNVVSPVSGISNDPTQGLTRATPLGMHFWCHNIDRLLCVDTVAAGSYAALLSAPSHVIALAHTTSYGGAGGTVTTLAGENPESHKVIVHEMGHTLAGLGDEYVGPADFTGGPPPPAVTDTHVADVMLRDKLKWYRWIGKPSADGGLVGAFEGSNYFPTGYFRPSIDSEMRHLGRPFNPPSIESLIESFYVARGGSRVVVDPIDTVSPVPDGNGVTDAAAKLSVTLIPLVGHDYAVYWGVNGTAVPGSQGATTMDLSTAPLTKGKWNQVSVYVVDKNPAVQDEDFRTQHMTKTRLWWVWGG